MFYSKLKNIFSREQFKPGLIGLFINPFYFARKGLYENISSLSPHIKGKILDVGCGQKPYKDLFQYAEYIGLEIEKDRSSYQDKADCYYDGREFPFQDNSFDSVLINQVFEHVFNPSEFLREVYRVLKTKGTLLISVPFVWDEHEQPFDYARYSSFGLVYILQSHGFKVLEHRKSIDDIRVIFQLTSGFFHKKFCTGNAMLDLMITLILISPLNILGEIFGFIFPRNSDLYLDNVIVARKE
jgi:SAM-dependent methyltransferase